MELKQIAALRKELGLDAPGMLKDTVVSDPIFSTQLEIYHSL
jgi:hypothetical protein